MSQHFVASLTDSLIRAASSRGDVVIARDDGGRIMTLEQLLAHAARTRSALAARNLAGGHVAVWMPRDVWLLPAILGAWQSGATVVPLELGTSNVQVSTVAERTRARAVLTVGRHAADSQLSGLALVSVDRLAEVRPEPRDTIETAREPADAYVMFTSGSTGARKGVPISFGNLENYLRFAAAEYLGSGNGTIVHSSLSVDLTITSLLLPLFGLETAHFVNRSDALSLSTYLSTYSGPGLSFLKLTPGQLRLLLELMSATELRRVVRHLVIGGEALHAADIEGLRGHDFLLTNEYGPTEATVGCLVSTGPVDEYAAGPVPIGSPIPGVAVALVEPDPHVDSNGVRGELHVSGKSLSRGYLPDPGSTSSESPFYRDSFGASWYRTGDIVERVGDDLYFVGRTAGYHKIHGYRVHLGEVENSVADLGVHSAAVVMHREREPLLVLVAEASESDIDRIREHLRSHLPAHMMPVMFVPIDSLPVASGGKVDRELLLELVDRRLSEVAELESHLEPAPSNVEPVRRALEECLGRRVDASDNFFAIGGTSLTALRVIQRCAALGIELDLKAFLLSETVAEIERHARASAPRYGSDDAPKITTSQRAVLDVMADTPAATFTISAVFEHRLPLDEPVADALEQLVRRHAVFKAVGEALAGAQSRSNKVARTVRVTVDEFDPRVAVALRDDQIRLIADGALVSASIVDVRDSDSAHLLLTCHHLCADLVSLSMAADELTAHADAPAGLDNYVSWSRTDVGIAGAPRATEVRVETCELPMSDVLRVQDLELRLATALRSALASVGRAPDFVVERHGRSEAALASTFGWLSTADRPSTDTGHVAFNYVGRLASRTEFDVMTAAVPGPSVCLYDVELVAATIGDSMELAVRFDAQRVAVPVVTSLLRAVGDELRTDPVDSTTDDLRTILEAYE